MKKIILTMMFTFAFTTIISASSKVSNDINSTKLEIKEAPDCYDIATAYEEAMGGGYEYFSAAYDLCCGC